MEKLLIFNVSFNLFHLSKYRTQLMGVAALMIILCHAPAYGVDIQGIPRKLLVFGNIGVDIFLFLSGMGCWFSLTKSPGYFPWLKRRFIRIFIPYTIVLLILRILSLWVDHTSWGEWLLYFSTLRFWTHHDGMWYVALLLLLYPVAPLLYKVQYLSKRPVLTAFTLIVMLLVITHLPIDKGEGLSHSVVYNLQWTFKRVVSFILGICMAPYVKQGFKVNALSVIGISALGCIIFHFFMREVFYVWLYVLPMLIFLCAFFDKLPYKSSLSQFFLWMGDISLESYLWNVGFNVLIPLCLCKCIFLPLFAGHYFDYALIVVFGLFLSYITHHISENFKKKYCN